MAFRLAEAYVELKARGEKELHKSLEKTKEKVKDVAPAADQTEKKIEQAAQQAAKGVEKSATAMVKSLQKPIDKLAQLEAEMKAKFSALNQRADNLRSGGTGVTGGGGLFGRLGVSPTMAAGAGLVGIAAAVAQRGNALQTSGEDSRVLGPQVSAVTRDVVRGLKEFSGEFTKAGSGFVDGLLGLAAWIGNVVTFGGLGRWGESARKAEQWQTNDRRSYQEAIRTQRQIEAIDARGPIRAMEGRNELDRIFRRGGIEGLESAASALDSQQNSIANAEKLRAINERIAQEKDKAARAAEQSAAAAEREARAFREAGQMATWGPGRALDIATEAWRTGRPAEVIDAQRKFNLSEEDAARMEARMRGLDILKGAQRTAGQVEGFADRAADRAASLMEEDDAVKKLRREYEALAAAVAALPAGAGKDAAQGKLAEARMNVVAAEALDAERKQNAANRKAKEDALREGADKEIEAIRKRFEQLEFDAGNKARPTTSFQQVAAQDFAKLIQADVFAKEDEQRRVEEAKAQHEEAQKLRQQQVDEIKGVRQELEKGLKAVAG